jgi:hypothetical protein
MLPNICALGIGVFARLQSGVENWFSESEITDTYPLLKFFI